MEKNNNKDNWCSNSELKSRLESSSCNNAECIGNRVYAPQCFSLSKYLKYILNGASPVDKLSSSEENNFFNLQWKMKVPA